MKNKALSLDVERRWATVMDLRADTSSRRLSGTVVRYGDTAKLWGSLTETIQAGAFSYDDVILNLMHDRGRPISRSGAGLELIDDSEQLRMTATIADTTDGNDAIAGVRAGLLRGLSVEMRIESDEYPISTHRIIRKASLEGIGIVPSPAYTASNVEARWSIGPVMRCEWALPVLEQRQFLGRNTIIAGLIPYGKESLISMRHNQRQIIEPGAFDNLKDGEVFLLSGYEYDKSLASTAAGTLRLRDSKEGVTFRTRGKLPTTTAAKDAIAKMNSGLIGGVVAGYVPHEVETSPIAGGGEVKRVKKASLCEINLVSRATAGGRAYQAIAKSKLKGGSSRRRRSRV